MAGVVADWVTALGVVALVVITWIVARWKAGRRRRFRVTVVIERDFDGPDAPQAPPGSERD